MKTLLLAAGAVAAALTAGQALAAPTHHRAGASATATGPKQPIPYAELGAYLKASPKQRASKDWWSEAQASTGGAANTSAVSSAGAEPSASPPPPATPPVARPPASDVTPPPTDTTPAGPVNPPPKSAR